MEAGSNKVSGEVKEHLKEQYNKLNPIELKRKIDKLQDRLQHIYKRKEKERKQKEKLKHLSSNIPNNGAMKQNDFVYNLGEATK